MTNTVTINIQNNCGCGDGSGAGSGGGGSSGSGSIIEVPWEELPPPGSNAGPPAGYITAAAVSDRQCRVAIFNYWWVFYFTDKLANTVQGATYVSLASDGAIPTFLKTAIASMVSFFAGGAIVSMISGGIGAEDAAIFPIAGLIATAIAAPLTYFISEKNVTIPLLQDALTILPQVQDRYICALSKTSDPAETQKAIENVLSDPVYGLSITQQEWVIHVASFTARLLYYSADWWPSFDTDFLTSITANCCGSFVDGTPLLPSSTEGCQTSWYIVDKLVATFSGIQQYWNWYWWDNANLNPYDDDTAEIFDIVKTGLSSYIPPKVLQRASNKNEFNMAIAQYINHQTLGVIGGVSDYNWSNLAAHLTTNRQSVVNALAVALDENDAYDAVYNPLEAWLDTNVTDTDLNSYMKAAINGLIQPTGSIDDYLNMLFYQDADLATYAALDCAGGGGNCPEFQVLHGAGPAPVLNTQLSYSGTYLAGPNLYYVAIVASTINCPCQDFNFDVSSYSGTPANSGHVQRCDGSYAWRYNVGGGYSVLVGNTYAGQNIWVVSSTPFSVSTTISEQ